MTPGGAVPVLVNDAVPPAGDIAVPPPRRPEPPLFGDFMRGIWKENPILVQMLGMCPTMAITNNVGAGRSAPKDLNTSLNAGITKIMITVSTTKATTITAIGYINPDLIFRLISSVFS